MQPAYVPVTAHDRWHTYLKNLVSPVSFLRAGFSVTFGVSAGFRLMREFLPDLWHRK